MSPVRWLVLPTVCAAHFALLIGFSNGNSKYSAKKTDSMIVRVVESIALNSNIQKIAVSSPQRPSLVNTALATPVQFEAKPDEKIGQEQAAQTSRLFPPVFKSDKFINVEDLDVPAVGASELETVMNQTLPTRFDFVVLEFLIDEAGRTVQVACIEGDCSESLKYKIQALLAVPFEPALKNGQAVASRKVIYVLPVPTYGL